MCVYVWPGYRLRRPSPSHLRLSGWLAGHLFLVLLVIGAMLLLLQLSDCVVPPQASHCCWSCIVVCAPSVPSHKSLLYIISEVL